MECSRKKRLVQELNEFFICKLCHGYLVDATTLVDCLHTFCRGCILRHFENSKAQTQCPVCTVQYKKKSQCFRSDTQLQALVYKSVPSLYLKEMQRQEDFYRSTGVRAGSSCSDDSVIDRERDMMHETEEMISQYVGDKTQYFHPDDPISISLEYYQPHLDTTDTNSDIKLSESTTPHTNINTSESTNSISNTCVENSSDSKCDSDQPSPKGNGQICSDNKSSDNVQNVCDKRYLQCPAGVKMKLLQKFLRMKNGLTGDHRVDIIYKGEVLPNDFSLMDVAYSFQWEKKKPMRFFYRIFFTPMKIKPIKIVNTPTPTGEKKLQIVPVTSNNHIVATSPRLEQGSCGLKSPKSPRFEKPLETKDIKHVFHGREETESEQLDKETLMANLQLQSKTKAMQIAEAKKVQIPEKIVKECVFEFKYEEPDQEEIKRFAEKRDREWALQAKLDEETKPEKELYYSSKDNYPTKKRKKSKHSKNDSNGHKEKKRKLHAVEKIHAEITNNDKSDLKLKVKITTNGHKHKHHKIESSSELSHKEKLLQMRQVRHKHMSGSSGDERSQPAIPTIKLPKTAYVNERTKETNSYSEAPEPKRKKECVKPSGYSSPSRISENNNKPLEPAPKPRIEPMIIKPIPTANDSSSSPRAIPSASKSLAQQPGIASAKIAKKEVNPRGVSFEHTDRHSQKTFLKAATANAEKYSKDQKINQGKIESIKAAGSMSNRVLPIGSITTNNNMLDIQILNLQQRCTIEPKNPASIIKADNKMSSEKTKATSQYPPGFTVSKIESGVKRKAEEAEQDKRPSLEITLIPPTTGPSKATDQKPVNKRPPPATIPLDRIKNAMNLKSGISIIPKMPDRTDNNGVLDLSKPNKSPDTSPRSSPKTEPINGLNSMLSRQIGNMTPRPMGSPSRGGPESKHTQLSNLQMLSKVATEHPTLNKFPANNVNKARPQLPSLQTIRPGLQTGLNAIRSPGVQRMPPKLNDIQKFRPTNPQARNVRPNQNQNIRNIPNPSLILNRHQNLNQNRLVSSGNFVQANAASDKKVTSPKISPVPSVTSSTNSTKDLPIVKSAILEQKVTETKEISV